MENAVPASRSDKTTVGAHGPLAGKDSRARVEDVCIRNDLRPGDLGSLIHLHGILYAKECEWDHTFEAYVAGPLSQFALKQGPRDRIWIVERQGQVAGSIAIAEVKRGVAQLRWFLIHPNLRGQGLGKRLLQEALSFSRKSAYRRLELWTTRNLTTAAHLYLATGFELSQEITHELWGQIVTEQRYDLRL